MGRKPSRQSVTPAKAMRAACKPRMLLLQVSLEVGNRTDGNSAAALPGAGRRQSAPRGNDDLCYRRRFHQVDVLGSHIADTSAVVELVHFVRSTRAPAWRRNYDRVAGELSIGPGAIRNQLRGRANGTDVGGILRVARHP